MILDPACGGRMFYFDKNDDRVLFCDIRNFETELVDNRFFAVKPDLRIDFTDMPFGDEQFNMVVFDPPHLLSKNELDEETGFMKIKYGSLKINNWKETLKKGFAECFRVLRVGGVLIFKWSEIDIKVKEVLKLTSQRPLLGQRNGKRGVWIVFIKEE